MRNFAFITVGKILKELENENCKIHRTTFYRIQEKLGIEPRRTTSKLGWRVYTKEEAEKIKQMIKEEYGFIS